MKEIKKTRLLIGAIDTLFVLISICIASLIKPGFSFHQVDVYYLTSCVVFLFIWIIVSHFSRKFQLGFQRSLREILSSVFISNFIILAIISVLLVSVIRLEYSRIIIFGTILFTTVFELFLGYLYYAILQSNFLQEWIGPEFINGNRNNGKTSLCFYN